MDETFITPVVNGNKARQHLFTIKSEHANILNGIQNQAQKVEQYNIQRSQQQQIENQQRQQKQQEDMKFNQLARQNSLDNIAKTNELSIKQQEVTTRSK